MSSLRRNRKEAKKTKPKQLLLEPLEDIYHQQQPQVIRAEAETEKASMTGENDDFKQRREPMRADVINANRCKRADSGQRKDLSSLLMILFGVLLVIIFGQSCARAELSSNVLFKNNTNNSSIATLSLTTVTKSPAGNTSAPTRSKESEVSVTKTTSAVGDEEEEADEKLTTTVVTETLTAAPEGDEGTSSTDSVAKEKKVEEEEELVIGDEVPTGASKLSNLIADAAGEAADQLVGRLRNGKSDNESDESEETGAGTIAEANNQAKKRQTKDNPKLSRANITEEEEIELKLAMDTYTGWRLMADEIIELFSRKMLPVIVEHGYDVDAVTVTGLLQVFNGIRTLKPWALKLLDASAKLTPGLLVGTQSDFGDFDECLNIRVDDPSGLDGDNPVELDETTGLRSSTLVGRYCLADVEFPKPPRRKLDKRNEELKTDFAPIELRRPLLNFNETAAFKDTIFVETANFFHMLYVDPIRIGVCLTNKIDSDNFSKVFNKIFQDMKVTIDFKGRCVTKYDKQVWSIQQKVSAYLLLVACSLVCLCTALDLLHTKLAKLPLPAGLSLLKLSLRASLFKFRPIFTSFSIIRNTKRLFKSQVQKSSQPNQQQQPSQFNLNLAQAISNQLLTSTESSQASLSIESSPSIERRSSLASSALNLITELPAAVTSQKDGKNLITMNGNKNKISASNIPASEDSATLINLRCLHGVRVITMTWMIINHTYLFGGFFVIWAHRRLIDIAEWPKSLSFQLVLNGWLTVETYFFLSAAIIVLNVMPLMRANKFAYFTYVTHRLIRLLPAYIGLVSLNFLWPLISSGPVWMVKGRSFIQTPCENYLWTNFLFINNWIWPENQCMVHTWFLSADFQLYLLAPIIVYLLYRRPVFGHSLNIIVAIIASAFSGFVIYANKLMPSTLINKLEFDSIKLQLSYSYFATYQHMSPYCLGILIGYLLHKRPQMRLPSHLTWSLWLLLPPLSFTTLLLTYLWNGAYDDPALINPSPLVSAFYVAIHRTIWTSLVAWIVFACATGRAKLLSNFLSHSFFIPISRLSFSIYLVHLPVIMFRALNLRHTIEWSDSNILWEACGNLIVSIIVAYLVNMTFESPIINLEQAIFGKRAPGRASGATTTKQLASKTAANSDSESASDTENKTNTIDSSPEQERKSSSASSTETQNAESWSEKQNQKQPQSGEDNLIERKAFRPKQSSSVEQIFGNQVEPTALPSYQGLTSLAKQQMAQRSSVGYNDSIYLIDSGGAEYFRGQSQRLMRQRNQLGATGSPRPPQYATLARTSRFSHDNPNRSFNVGQSHLLASDRKPRSHLSEPISQAVTNQRYLRRQQHQQPDEEMFQNESLVSPSRQRRAHLALVRGQQNRKQGRYNTLTEADTREWRRQCFLGLLDDDGDGDELQTQPTDWRLMSGSSTATFEDQQNNMQVSSWLQPGALIPRIDSSTLRRNHLQTRLESGAGSIVEEPTNFDDEASNL